VSFLLGMFLLLPQHFRWFKLLYRCGDCYINIAGRKPVSSGRLRVCLVARPHPDIPIPTEISSSFGVC
jgi:hypothetical protein